jgi:hypothetical protein
VRDNGRPVETVHFAAGAERVALLFLAARLPLQPSRRRAPRASPST